MAAVSRGDKTKRAFKVVKRKKATESHKNHRFESFNQRIAKLNIDPVRRTTSTYQDLADQDLSASTSHFRVALDEWSDKNLTEQFSNFLRDAEPLSETLPQLLHHQERVADLLLSYIENAPTTSLEPLLDLLAQFAHDLGERFETFFERSVCTLATIARTNPDIEAIEWSLNAVVWLFKYLSRLLVPDLRPTYDLLAPLLGREKQKPFIARFAAEGFSFLLKKAGLGYNKGQEPLKKIVGHILQDLRDTDGNELYQQGLMTLFADSMRGVQRGLHSAALPILKELLRVSLEKTNDSGNNARRTVIHGVLISLIHHCDGDSFAPALQTVLDATEVPVGAPTEIDVQMSIRFLFELAGVRSGSRITNWKIIFERLQALFDLIEQSPVTHESLCADALASAAVIFQHCPLGEAYPFLRLLERTTSTFWKPHFISFCMFFADMGSERFKTMLLPRLQKFVLAEWQSSPTELVALLTSLTPLGVLESKSVAGAKVERDVVEGFRRLRGEVQNDPPDMGLLHLCNSELDIFELLEPSKQKREDSLVIVAQNVLADFAPRTSELNLYWHFAFGRCFEFLCQTHPTRSETTSALNRALSLSAGFVGLLPYWRSVHQYLSNLDSTAFEQIPGFDGLLESSVRCLALPSHQIRLCGLRVLYHSFRLQGKPIPAILETALAIEESPFDIHNVRLISMRIRKLAAEFKHVSSDPLLCRAIPTYCFGLLHVHLTQAWNDASAALKEMCEEKTSEDVVAQLALKWMEGSEAEWDEMHDEQADHVAESQQRRFYTDFECSHLERLDELHASCLEKAATPKEQLKSRFEKTHRQVPEVTTACRAQALRVLRLIPHVAERRSRLLVPLFLDWAQNAQADDFDTSDNEDSIPRSADLCKQRWNRKDQKSMVSLLSTFTNPRVLYQSEAVHASFLSLLCNGDAELQKPALQALLAWKPPAVEPYREELFKFLDNDRFREQLSVFLGVGSEDSVIKDEHRQVLMPVLLRVLYGRMIAKGGAAAKGGGLESRRKAVFIELTRFGDETLSQFLSISLGPLGTLELLLDGEVNDEALGKELMTPRKQQGLLNMLKDMLTTLKKSFSALAKHLIEPILYCLFRAAAIMGAGEADSMVHSVRQMSLQCLVTMFEQFPDLQWVAYIRPIFYRFINQRLANLSVETAHSISGLMKLFGAWAAAAETAPFLFQYNDEVVPQLAKCLTPESAKDDVKSFVLQLLRQLGYVAASTPVAKEGLQRHGKDLLAAIETVLRGHAPKEVLDLAIDTVQVLAPSIPKDQCIGLIEICTFLLQQPPKRVRPKTKGEILQALIPIFSHVANAVSDIDVVDGFEGLSAGFELAFDLQGRVDPVSENTQAGQLIRGTYSALSSLFAYFEDQENRTRLAELFELLVNPVPSLRTIAAVAQDLNSFSDSRVGEPDFQRRSEAVDIIRSQSQAWSLHQWMPIVHTLLFHVKDEDDGIRANASLGLKRFVEASAVAADETKEDGFSRFTEEVLLPSINRGLQQRAYSELVRADYLAVLAHTINHLRGLESIHDMQCLLSSDDEEASFFVNILHIQQHRRLRALRRLVKEVQNGSIMSRNISRFFIPLIEHFVFDPHEDENAHNLTAEAITTIGHLSGWLEWSQYRALLKRYSSFVERKHALEKTMMKLLGVLVDALCRAERDNGGAEDTAEPEIDMVQASTALPHSRLGATLPSRTRLSEELQKSILPQLSGYLHHKDEATVSRRVPVAITIAKMLRVLPEAEFTMRLPPMLMDLSHILRSRSQESRDLTRKTFAEITALIGSMHFGFVLKELRRALQYVPISIVQTCLGFLQYSPVVALQAGPQSLETFFESFCFDSANMAKGAGDLLRTFLISLCKHD